MSYQIGYCRPLLETISSTGCTFETWVYELKNPITGATIAWYPCRPNQVVFAYTVLGTTCASVETDESGPVAQPAGSIRVLANPTRHDVKATFTIEQPGETRMEVYDVKGTLVRCLDCLYLEKGSHAVVWDGNDRNGRPVSPGVYFFQVTSIQGSMKAKVVRLR
jgi:flagellar hook assembly protein FlgD